jgi:2-polyprenyl-3-methyl-5-hydroxy-6-metoxy-1,4-benzoquinol methylase
VSGYKTISLQANECTPVKRLSSRFPRCQEKVKKIGVRLVTVQREIGVARPSTDNESRSKAESDPHAGDPLAIFLSDPESHYSDLLYLNFRIYKKRLLWNFAQTAFAKLNLDSSKTLYITDIGASMGFDVLYLLRKLSQNFSVPLPCKRVIVSLVEGDENLIAEGERIWKNVVTASEVGFQYYCHPLVEALPLEDESQHLAICSEVVEHLQEPAMLLQEMFRKLKPGGFLILTTDNSPSLLQRIRRIPVWLRGRYREVYCRESTTSEVVAAVRWNAQEYPIFGHINLNCTRHWEKISKGTGFKIASYGTYESIRRGGGTQSPFLLAGYFVLGAMVYHLMPRSLGRYFGDTTALLLRKSEY